jgi:hypothetical protein
MKKVKKYIGDGKHIFISLQEALNIYNKEAPEGWFDYIEGWVNEGLKIKNEEEYQKYLKKMNLKWFNYEKVNTLYQSLKLSKYNKMLEDDVLRYIAHIYGLGYFERTNYEINISNPDLDRFLNTNNVFSSNYVKGLFQEDEMYSILDLLSLNHGMNAIRKELLLSSKW